MFYFFTIANVSDPEYLSNLYCNHYRLMYRVAMSILKNHHDAEDVLQSAILRFNKNADTFKRLSHEEQQKYICKSILNASYRKAKDRNRLTNLVNLDEDPSFDTRSSESAEAEYIQFARLDDLLSVISQLPKRESDLFYMKYLNDWTDAQIGEALSVKPGSVRVYWKRTKEHIRTILGGLYDNDR